VPGYKAHEFQNYGNMQNRFSHVNLRARQIYGLGRIFVCEYSRTTLG